jgi:hypothetical protein
MGKPDPDSERLRLKKAFAKDGKCERCPPHDGENRRRRPRSDRHKNKRR